MNTLLTAWAQADALARLVGLLLLGMSVASWVTLLHKAWMLRRAEQDLPQALHAFWQAPSLTVGRERLAALDRLALALPLLDAAAQRETEGSLASEGGQADALTRRLRQALQMGQRRLQRGQVLLASIGATAPFVGLFGTVWSIHGALRAMGAVGSAGGSWSLERIATPVGEALVMTAAGLAVAIPAVLAYNLFGRWIAACEAELEGYAHDLLQRFGSREPGPAARA